MANTLSNSERRQFWESHIAQCTASGLRQAEYCRLNEICIKSFYYWKRRSRKKTAPALVEVPIPKSFSVLSSHPPLCLVIGMEYRIEIGRSFDSEDLERVVRTLRKI